MFSRCAPLVVVALASSTAAETGGRVQSKPTLTSSASSQSNRAWFDELLSSGFEFRLHTDLMRSSIALQDQKLRKNLGTLSDDLSEMRGQSPLFAFLPDHSIRVDSQSTGLKLGTDDAGVLWVRRGGRSWAYDPKRSTGENYRALKRTFDRSTSSLFDLLVPAAVATEDESPIGVPHWAVETLARFGALGVLTVSGFQRASAVAREFAMTTSGSPPSTGRARGLVYSPRAVPQPVVALRYLGGLGLAGATIELLAIVQTLRLDEQWTQSGAERLLTDRTVNVDCRGAGQTLQFTAPADNVRPLPSVRCVRVSSTSSVCDLHDEAGRYAVDRLGPGLQLLKRLNEQCGQPGGEARVREFRMALIAAAELEARDREERQRRLNPGAGSDPLGNPTSQ